MGIPSDSPLEYLLENLQPHHLALNLEAPKFICFCNQIWPKHPLDNSPNSHLTALDPNVIQDLYSYCDQ